MERIFTDIIDKSEKVPLVSKENRNLVWTGGIEWRAFNVGRRATHLDLELAVVQAERQGIRFRWHQRLMRTIDQILEIRRSAQQVLS